MVKELCCAIKGDFPQIRSKGDDANVIFYWEGFRVLRRGYRTHVCTEFEMLKVKVPIIFLGTAGFSPLREGRYII